VRYAKAMLVKLVRSIFSAKPRFRILKFVRAFCARPLRHRALSTMLRKQWHYLRRRTSWSRA
jgi:hypothetical protein